MANPIIKIKRGATAPVATLNAGEFAIDQVAKNLYLGVEVGGVVTNEIVGGNGTFATHTDVATAVTNATGSLGTMSTQDADAVAITGGAIDGTAIGATTPSTGAFTTLTASNAPSASTDVVRKTDLDSAISALGSVFHYVGNISAFHDGISGSGDFVLPYGSMTGTETGSYFTVDVAGGYRDTNAATTFNAKVGDAIVKTSTGWQKIDNVDVVVTDVSGETVVTGTEDTGYTVGLAPAFVTRMGDAETKTQNIDLTDTTAGTTRISGDVVFGTGINAHNFKVSSSGTVSINSMTNSSTVDTFGTLNINAGGGLGGVGAWIGLQSSGHLVANGAGLEIQGFIIDGGAY